MRKPLTAYELGQKHADLFLGFACFLEEQATLNEIDTLFFCTREGVFFKAVFDTLFGNVSNGLGSAPKSDLIEVSRLSSFAPALMSENSIDFSQLYRLYKTQSPLTLMSSLGQDVGEFEELIKKHGLSPSEFIDTPGEDEQFNSFLADPAFLQRISANLREQKSCIQQYLQQHFGDRPHIGFVEIGWRGTIQNSIAALFPEKKFLGMYLGLALERNKARSNCQKIAYGPDHNRTIKDSDLLDAINVIEFICLSNKGSAKRYQRQADGSVIAEMQHVPEEDRWIEDFSIPFQRGVLEVAEKSNREALIQDHQSGKLRAKALDQWRSILNNPQPALVTAYFSVKSNEQFGHGSISDQSVVPTLSTIVFSPFNKSRRQQLITFLTYSQWSKGMLHRTDLKLPSRVMFYLLMSAASRYKALVHRRSRKNTLV